MILRIATIALVLVVAGCDGAEEWFPHHVYAGPGVSGIVGDKASCMHCPLYFKFRVSGKATHRAIIARHRLTRYMHYPPELQGALSLGYRQFDWWRLPSEAEIYVSYYKPKEERYEEAFRLFVLSGDTGYFMTSGFYNERYYERLH